MRSEALLAHTAGFTFVGTIHHERSRKLEAAEQHESAPSTAGAPNEGRPQEWAIGSAANNVAVLRAAGLKHPAFAPTVRLAKRWIACQLLTSLVKPEIIEHFACVPFFTPGLHPPGALAVYDGCVRWPCKMAVYDGRVSGCVRWPFLPSVLSARPCLRLRAGKGAPPCCMLPPRPVRMTRHAHALAG